MNNAAIKTYEVEEGPIKKIVVNINLDELYKHPEILGEEITNYLKIVNLLGNCIADLKTAYEYAACSKRLIALVDEGYKYLKDVLGADVADAAKYAGVDGYVMTLFAKEIKIATELAKHTNEDIGTLTNKLNNVVNLLAKDTPIEEIARKTNTPVEMVKLYLEELKKKKKRTF